MLASEAAALRTVAAGTYTPRLYELCEERAVVGRDGGHDRPTTPVAGAADGRIRSGLLLIIARADELSLRRRVARVSPANRWRSLRLGTPVRKPEGAHGRGTRYRVSYVP